MPMTTLDGRAFGKFVAAGTYFLGKYRDVLNDLNVFPVPTARAALREAAAVRDGPVSVVAAAVAKGSLLGAWGNSGVILSQMFRGFAHFVRHRESIDTFQLAVAMKDALRDLLAPHGDSLIVAGSRPMLKVHVHTGRPADLSLAADEPGIASLYYGEKQKERDAQRYAAELGDRFDGVTVEYYFGGQTDNEYWVSFER